MFNRKFDRYLTTIFFVNIFLLLFVLFKHFVLAGSFTISMTVLSGYIIFVVLTLTVGYYNLDKYTLGKQNANSKLMFEIVSGIKIELVASFIIWILVSCVAYLKYYASFKDQNIAIGTILVAFFFIYKQLIELLVAGILIGMINWKYRKS